MADRPQTAIDAELEAAQAALSGTKWTAARRRFEAVIAQNDESPEAWEGLGSACYWLQDAPRLFEARQHAYQRYQARGDSRGAARIATWLAADFLEFRGEPAVATGWLERARQLLEGLPPSQEHAWLREMEGYLALAVRNDPEAARAAAVEAREIARALGDQDHEMLARAMEGLALVARGDIAEGMRRLDASAAAALGGDMADLNAISVTCCYVIQACERVRDFERAAEWCSRFEDLCARFGLGTFLTFCRIQHGTVLLWRGDWRQAEVRLLAAQRDLEAVRPTARAAALVRLGELRRRQGRWEDAAALLEAGRSHRLAALTHSALALDQGDALTAEELAEQALRRLPDLDGSRAAALDLIVRARAARGATEEAAHTLAQLESLAARISTEAVNAMALFATAVLARARGAEDQARRLLEDAADLFEAAHAPFETAAARLELARSLLGTDRRKPAEAQARAALETFTHLGAERHAAEAREVLRLAQGPAGRLTRRQSEILRLVAQGLGNREIAARLSLSEYTIRRHLANIYVRLGVSTRTAAVALALRHRWV